MLSEDKYIWDYKDDYYYTNINNIEINIRIFEDDSYSIWIYNYIKDEEIIDKDYKNINEVKVVLKDVFKMDISIPSISKLKKIMIKD